MVSARLYRIFARSEELKPCWAWLILCTPNSNFLYMEEFYPLWSWRASRAYPVTSQPFSCPYQDSVHIEFYVDYVSFLFVSFRIPKQWGGTSMRPSCLNGFRTNPGQSWDCAVWSNQSFWLYWPLCLKMTLWLFFFQPSSLVLNLDSHPFSWSMELKAERLK